MCRNIRTLFNFEPPATEDEIHASALQFVRKLSGFAKPSRVNEAAFNRAVDEVTETAASVAESLETASPARQPRSRSREGARAGARAVRVRRIATNADVEFRRYFPRRLLACSRVQLVNGGGDAGAAAQRIFQVDRAAVFLEQIAQRLVGQFLKILHLVVAEQVQLLPGLFVDLDTFPRHGLPFLEHVPEKRTSVFRKGHANAQEFCASANNDCLKLPWFGGVCPSAMIDGPAHLDLSFGCTRED